MVEGLNAKPLKNVPIAAIAAAGFLLAACGGGAAAPPAAPITPPASPPPPPPPPAPPPPPPPPTTDSTSAEFLAQPGLAQVNAAPAFDMGINGDGALIAFVDTGIDIDNPEFEGRIDPGTADLAVAEFVEPDEVRAGGPDPQDVQGHGTSGQGIAAAGFNGSGIVGVAPEARLLSFRGNLDDDPDTDEDEALLIVGGAIVEGAIQAAAADADVINFSLGSDGEGALEGFTSVIGFLAANDVVTAIAAGNEGPMPDPVASAQAAITEEAAGTAIVVGSVDGDNELTSFSNAAGVTAEFFVVAPGLFVPTPEIGGGLTPFSGTSASTPHVSGAVALIRAQWPQLTAAETVEIILETATDLGAPGTDEIFGRGLLNIGAALDPVGPLSIATASGASVPAADLGNSLSSAFGAGAASAGPVVGLDEFGRDFEVDLSSLNSAAKSSRFSAASAVSPFNQVQSTSQALPGGGEVTVRFSEASVALDPELSLYFSDFSSPDAIDAAQRDVALSFTQALGQEGRGRFTFAQGLSARQVDRAATAAFQQNTLSRDAFVDAFLPLTNDAVTGVFSFAGPLDGQVDVLVNRARTGGPGPVQPVFAPGGNGGDDDTQTTTTVRLGYTRAVPHGLLRFETGLQTEEATILGARFSEALLGGEQGTQTLYNAISGRFNLPGGIYLKGRYAVGFSSLPSGAGAGFVVDARRLRSTQFSFGLEAKTLFTEGDHVAISLSQPLRVRGGGVTLALPTSFDQIAEEAEFTEVFTGLGDRDRPLDIEASYALPDLAGFGVGISSAYGVTGFGAGETVVAIEARKRF